MHPDAARIANLILAATDWLMRPWYRWSGLDALAARFPAGDPPDEYLTRETIRLNHIKWRGVVALGLCRRGLHLAVATAPAALIPWEQILDRGPARLYGRRAHALDLGLVDPVALIVYDELYQQIAPWLAGR